jgi:hypothetical protein
VTFEGSDEGLCEHAFELGGGEGAGVFTRTGEGMEGRVEVARDRGSGGRGSREVVLQGTVHRLDLLLNYKVGEKGEMSTGKERRGEGDGERTEKDERTMVR